MVPGRFAQGKDWPRPRPPSPARSPTSTPTAGSGRDRKSERGTVPGIRTDQVEFWTRRVVDARLEAATDRDQRIAILAEDFERTKAIEARMKESPTTTPWRSSSSIRFKAEFYRLDAEYRLAKEKGSRHYPTDHRRTGSWPCSARTSSKRSNISRWSRAGSSGGA